MQKDKNAGTPQLLTDRQYAVMMDKLALLLKDNDGGYSVVAEKLGYTYSYVHQVASGKVRAGIPFYLRLRSAYRDMQNRPAPNMVRVHVDFYDEDMDAGRAIIAGMNMQQRRDALTRERID